MWRAFCLSSSLNLLGDERPYNKQVRCGSYTARDGGVYKRFPFIWNYCVIVLYCVIIFVLQITLPNLSESLTFFSKVILLWKWFLPRVQITHDLAYTENRQSHAKRMQTIYPEQELTLKEYQIHHLLNTKCFTVKVVAWYHVTDITVLPNSNHTFLHLWFTKNLRCKSRIWSPLEAHPYLWAICESTCSIFLHQ